MRRASCAQPSRPQQALGITAEKWHRLLAQCTDDLIGLRDRVLVSVGFDNLCRRGELVALSVTDPTKRADGRFSVLKGALPQQRRSHQATKLLYLILNRSEKEWKLPPREWAMAKAQFAVIFGKRFIRAMAAKYQICPPHTKLLTLPVLPVVGEPKLEQGLKQGVPDALLGQAAEPDIDRVSLAVALMHVALGQPTCNT